MPAVRGMTRKSLFANPASKRYLKYKGDLAQELSLSLRGNIVGGGRVTVSDKFPSYPLLSLVSCNIKFYRSDRRGVDIDNLLKMSLDLLQTSGIIKNDNQVVAVSATMEKASKSPRFEIEINII